MEIINVLHMNGGTGDYSYAKNSLSQREVISMTKGIREQAITDLYCANFLDNLRIADLGCSSGPNTFLVVTELIKTVNTICKKVGRNKTPEFQVYFNDLPGNDFNNIFRSLPRLQDNLKKEMGPGFGPCFFAGVPGSFYDRLFETNSIHFIHSSYSLHWLSKVPDLVETNKGNIYLASTSPVGVLKAYYEQFQRDFSKFLENRAKEMVTGGYMVLTFVGRTSDDASSKESCYVWELLAMVLNEMVLEGLIEEEKLDSFNMPIYKPSLKEVQFLVDKDGSFMIDRLEVSKVNWIGHDKELYQANEIKDSGENMAKCIRAVAEPILVGQFGDAIMDNVFKRYGEILDDCMEKERVTQNTIVIVSMTKKGDINHL